MTEKQKDQKVTGNQGGQQYQGQRKEGTSTEQSSKGTQQQGKQPDKKKQNGDKTPTGERNRQEDQGGNQNKNQKVHQGSDKRG